jgi:AbrB family looped-hinge helix DNA binding protein
MSSSSLSNKGQTTIPKRVRDAAGLRAGDELHFTVLEDGAIIVRVKNRNVRDLTIRPRKRRHITIEQMNR